MSGNLPKRYPRAIRFLLSRWVIGGAACGLLVAGAVGAVVYTLALRPADPADAPEVFTVESGEGAAVIADNLAEAGLIRDRGAFLTYLGFNGLRSELKAGTYSLSASMTVAQLARAISGGQVTGNRLTVPEGLRLAQIRKLVVARGIDGAAFDAALAAPHAQSFLASKPAGVSLEGYLFPDSYEIAPSTTAAGLVDMMLDTFGRRVGPEYVQAFAAQGLTLHQGLTLASIVEREVYKPADRPVVAQIFIKRFKEGMPLGSDVTTEYASDLAGVPFDLNINSPYNTRKFAGLPPGPIASPGLSALDAVARPANTDYTYFLSAPDGTSYFTKTYAEHQRNIDTYLK